MLRNILIGLGILILVLVGGAYLTPRNVHVERTVTINAPAQAIFPYLNDYRRFNEWSPWAHRDPNATYSFEGPERGVGARMTWSGNEQVGSGTQEIIMSDSPNRLETHLDFGDQGEAVAFFDLRPAGEATEVTWGFDTDMGLNPIGRYMGLMMDTWVGGDYEQGLANLKEAVESEGAN